MSRRIPLLTQCQKAFRDVPHDKNCLAATIQEDFPCGCTKRWRQIAGVEAMLRYMEQQRSGRKSRDELYQAALGVFTRAATRDIVAMFENDRGEKWSQKSEIPR